MCAISTGRQAQDLQVTCIWHRAGLCFFFTCSLYLSVYLRSVAWSVNVCSPCQMNSEYLCCITFASVTCFEIFPVWFWQCYEYLLGLLQNLTKLRRLNLDGNNFTKVPALPPSLVELKINDNKLSGLTPHSFKGKHTTTVSVWTHYSTLKCSKRSVFHVRG